jgi:hypothetical protein
MFCFVNVEVAPRLHYRNFLQVEIISCDNWFEVEYISKYDVFFTYNINIQV